MRSSKNNMEFLIRRAASEDVDQIMDIMREAKASLVHAQWFVSDNEEYVRAHLEDRGFILVAEAGGGELAGFFLAKIPDGEENLGTSLGFDREKLSRVMIMDTAAVAVKYRGNHLQSRLCQAVESRIDRERFRYLLCTVHPDNRFSLQNMQRNGFVIQKRVLCYGGLERYILMKELSPEK